ncbi:MAG TPA: ankyrin repeat domain-containing protein [Fimbriimonas sp.]|nr:ankyrin repeat domain-containing protein [Fimbriimonas sp.]
MEVNMYRQLPERANLEHLRDEAKALLDSLSAGESAALERAAPYASSPFQLAQAQLVIAREYGFDSWARLKRHVEEAPDRQVAFFAAVKAGDRERVGSLLAEDPTLVRVRDKGSFDAPALNLAASRNDIPLIDLLLDHGADPDAKSTWWAGGFCPLDFADEETSRHLIRRGARLTAHAAARLGLASELQALVTADPGVVHERGGDGQMPLHFAKTPEVVDVLVDAGADVDARDVDHEGTPAQHQIRNDAVLRRLLERGATPDVFTAVVLEDLSMLGRMLDEDPGALERATGEAGNPMIPQAPGAHIYTYTLGFVRPDQVASETVYQFLFDRGTYRQKLIFALWRGDRKAAHALLEEDPPLVQKLTEKDRKLLPQAAWVRNTSAVRLMLEVGFDPNIRGAENSTAIDRAAFHGFDDVIEAILPYGPDLTVRNAYGGTPLSCCRYGQVHGWRKDGDYVRSIELLLAAGARGPE